MRPENFFSQHRDLDLDSGTVPDFPGRIATLEVP